MALKKGISFVRDYEARVVLDLASKAALIDLVVDLLRRNAGDESLDGHPLIDAFVEAMEPVAVARGDKPIRPDAIYAKLEKRERERERAALAESAKRLSRKIGEFVEAHRGEGFAYKCHTRTVTVSLLEQRKWGIEKSFQGDVVRMTFDDYAKAVDYVVHVWGVVLDEVVFE